MAKAIITLILSLLALSCVANTHENLISELQPLWSSWKIYYGKAYSLGEESARFAIFVENYKKVVAFNNQSEDAKLGLNHFADLTEEEFKSMYTGFDGENARYDEESGFQEDDLMEDEFKEFGFLEDKPYTASANSVDWRTQGAVTSVDNQGSCGSCWAFSAVEALEGLYKIKKGSLFKFSKQQLVDCSSSYGNQGCSGGLMDNAFKYTKAMGIEKDSDYPYKGVGGICQYSSSKIVFKNTGFIDVPLNSYALLKAAVTRQPVSVAVQATGTIQLYKSGIITSNCGTALDHGVLIVGYGTSGSTDYWIVKNSWGASWGEAGYFRVKIGAENGGKGLCGINSGASYPTL